MRRDEIFNDKISVFGWLFDLGVTECLMEFWREMGREIVIGDHIRDECECCMCQREIASDDLDIV